MASKNNKTPAAAKFAVVGVLPGLIIFNGCRIDLSSLGDDELGQLHRDGCPYVAPAEQEASVEKLV